MLMRYTISHPNAVTQTMSLSQDSEKAQAVTHGSANAKCNAETQTSSASNVSILLMAGLSTDRLLPPPPWESPDNLDNPQNWPTHRKWIVTILVSLFSFNTLMTSTMVAPSLPQMSKDLHITSDAQAQLVLSSYVLSYAFGPFLWSPLSEVFGRMIILHVASTWFLIWNIVCGFASNKAAMIAGRVLSGAGAAAALCVSSGVLSDCWRPEERGKSLSVYTFLPLLGPTFGPIIGGLLSQHTTWRWAFWSTSAFDAVLQISALVILSETHAPTIVRRREERAVKRAGDFVDRTSTTRNVAVRKLCLALRRPFRLLFTQPVLQLLIVYACASFGILYILLSTMPQIFMKQYGQSPTAAGLDYLSFGIGFAIGAQGLAWSTDLMYKRRSSEQQPKPEIRIVLLLPATIVAALGLICFGWSIQSKVHWIVPNIGIVAFGAGTQFCTQCVSAYIIDIYGPLGWSASASSSNFGLKSIAGFGFPLFGPAAFNTLGYGWASCVFAAALVAVGAPVALTLLHSGEWLRKSGQRRLDAGEF